MTEIRPYKISVPDADLADLKDRLSRPRFPDELDASAWDLGVPLADLKRLTAHWRDSYDWRRAEAELNEYSHFETTIKIDGFDPIDVHFIHEQSPDPEAIPLLWVHGWPGIFYEGIKLIRPLVQGNGSEDSPKFHLVVPSLPNFGFSSATKQRGFSTPQHGAVLHQLMQKLGYDQYATQGGDWGYFITLAMGHAYPAHIKAQHVNLFVTTPPSFTKNPLLALRALISYPFMGEEERKGLERTQWFIAEGEGYNRIQRSKPQTLGYSLSDSPVGLLAWVYEKLHDWTDSYPWTDDEVCTWLSLYWFSRAGPHASVRLYQEFQHDPVAQELSQRFPGGGVKMGLSTFPRDVIVLPLSWTEQMGGELVFVAKHESGGHFPSWEKPDAIIADLRAMFGKGGGAHKAVAVGGKNQQSKL